MPLGSARFGLLGAAELGNLKLIQAQTFSSVSSAAFESIEESTYDVHFMTFSLIGLALVALDGLAYR